MGPWDIVITTAGVVGPLAFILGHWLGKTSRSGEDYDRGFSEGGLLAMKMMRLAEESDGSAPSD